MYKPGSNRLLESLSRKSRVSLLSRSNLVEMTIRQRISEVGGVPKSAYFMVSGLASEVVQLQDGEFVEIGIVGYEGVTGTYHLLGPASSLSHCFILMSGSAYELPYAALEELFATSPDVRAHVLKYVQHQMAHLGQTAACNRVHDAGPRFARWLLTIQDRTREKKFPLTHEFLAQMLGTSRPTVSIISKTFENAGLVGHTRGVIHILNRSGLQKLACACYETTRQVFTALYA